MIYQLRPYQMKLVDDIRDAFRKGFKAPLLQSPTGSGKTVVFAYITEASARKGNSIMILVHRQELLLQASQKLYDAGVAHGCISPGHSMTKDLVQVASVQTLIRRLDKYPEPNLIIVDECAHAAASSWVRILKHYENSMLLGVTATPERLDGKGLGISAGGFFDYLIEGPSPQELISQGYISKPVVYAPPSGVDTSQLHTRFGDYKQDELNELMDKPTITGCAIEHYQKICNGVPAIAFCVSIKHAEHIAQKFNESGIPAKSIDGKLSDRDRRSRIDDLAGGTIQVLTSCDLVSEGTDIPVVTAGIMLRPTQSMSLFLQQCGRAMRPHPSKTCSYILDHVGNVFRHGFPDDDREWSLDGIKKRNKKEIVDLEKDVNVIQCQNCYLVFKRGLPKCPSCGWVPELKLREIKQVDGELQEISEEEKERLRLIKKREIGKARTREELEAIARKNGYKPGWVHFIMESRRKRGIPV